MVPPGVVDKCVDSSSGPQNEELEAEQCWQCSPSLHPGAQKITSMWMLCLKNSGSLSLKTAYIAAAASSLSNHFLELWSSDHRQIAWMQRWERFDPLKLNTLRNIIWEPGVVLWPLPTFPLCPGTPFAPSQSSWRPPLLVHSLACGPGGFWGPGNGQEWTWGPSLPYLLGRSASRGGVGGAEGNTGPRQSRRTLNLGGRSYGGAFPVKSCL